MTRYIALEWDAREVRVSVANLRGTDMVVEDAFALPLTPSEPGETFADPDVGKMVAAALAERGASCSDALVAVGRASIELRLLTLPPAPPEEVADMVRFQAMQTFSAIGEDWPLDYVELETTEEAHKVLAASISPKLVSQINATCTSGHLVPRRLVLRPFAAASLLNRTQPTLDGRATLMVDVLADEADLTVMEDRKVVFMRTVRLPSTDDAEVQARALLGEIRRTIGAATNQLHGRRVDQFVVCGAADGHKELKTALSNALSVEVITFDPFERVKLAKSLRERIPENPGRFAPLLGMLADEVAGSAHAVDFLNPRKRPVPPSQKRQHVLIGATVAVALAAIVGTVWLRLNSLDRKIADLKIESAALKDVVDRSNAVIGKVDLINQFQDGDVTWLDEIRAAATHLPSADDTILDELSFGAAVGGGGSMLFKGRVRDSLLIDDFEDSLRYYGNNVSGKHGTMNDRQMEYPFLMEATVFVSPDKREEGRSLGRPYRDEVRELATQAMQEGGPDSESEPTEKDDAVTSTGDENTTGRQSS